MYVMERNILGVYNTRFGHQLVQITSVISCDLVDGTRYATINLITGKENHYYWYELWERPLDPDEYLSDITCSIENKEYYDE